MSLQTVDYSVLITRAPFSQLFPIHQETLTAITTNMITHGFDASKPIDVWGTLVIDGHTRLQAAKNAGIEQVYIYNHDFDGEETALLYAIANQRDRRNLTKAELTSYIARAVEAVDHVHEHGGDRRSEDFKDSAESLKGKSAIETAKIVGTSRATVERVRSIQAHGTEQEKQAIKEGTASINAAANAIAERRKQEKSQQVRNLQELTLDDDQTNEKPPQQHDYTKVTETEYQAHAQKALRTKHHDQTDLFVTRLDSSIAITEITQTLATCAAAVRALLTRCTVGIERASQFDRTLLDIAIAETEEMLISVKQYRDRQPTDLDRFIDDVLKGE